MIRRLAWTILATSSVTGLLLACSGADVDPDDSSNPGATGGQGQGATSGGSGGGNAAGGNTAATGGRPANSSTGGGLNVVWNGTGGSGSNSGAGGEATVQDGGTVDLTGEQVAEIQDAECTGLSAEAEKLPPVLQFVVDVSLSMNEPADRSIEPSQNFNDMNPGYVTKWHVTRDALLETVEGLPDDMAVGLQLYPTAPPGNSQCVAESGAVAIAPLGPAGSDQRTAFAAAVENVTTELGTPTHDAYLTALEESLLPYESTGDKFMLLITDGEPTQKQGCEGLIGDMELETEGVPVDPIIESVAGAASENIRTFAIGSPGSEDSRLGEDLRYWLSEAAMEGGTAQEGCTIEGPNYCHFDMSEAPDFSEALTEGLNEIATQVAKTCSFVPPDPGDGKTLDPDLTSVIINWTDESSELVLRDDVGECSEGWTWTEDGEIELCEATCETLETDAGAEVTVSLGCNPTEFVVK